MLYKQQSTKDSITKEKGDNMRAKEVQEIEARLLTQKQAETYTGMGRTALTAFVAGIGARRKVGRRVLYDKRVIDAALDAMATPTATN